MNDEFNDVDVDDDYDHKSPDIEDAGIYIFADEFNSSSTSKAIRFILSKNIMPKKKRLGNLTLIINSPGGELSSAFALIDIMKGSRIPVYTLGVGEISSCGLLTFMAGEKGHRIVTPNTSILSHQYSWGSYGKEHELIARMKEYNNTSERMLAHYKKCTGLNEKKIKEILMPPEDVWLSAKEAVKYGIADHIKSTY